MNRHRVRTVTSDLAIRGVTHRITIPVVVLGTSDVQDVGEIGGRLSLCREVDVELRIAAQARAVTR